VRRAGLWVANGRPDDAGRMLSWRPGALTCFHDYLEANQVARYKRDHPDVPVIVRFQHPRNWHEDLSVSAYRHAEYVLSKWPEIRDLEPYVYFCNEMNLHYENAEDNPANQWRYETPEFYQQCAQWVRQTADTIKQRAPEMRLVCPPFAFGHHEDGAPDDDGHPKDGWAGYDFLAETIKTHFDNIITFHAYWGNSGGSVRDWLYDPELSSWYAFRWRRVLKLFQTRYGIDARVIIDEAGNFGASDLDFTDQVIYYAREALMNPWVLALTFFLWQDPTCSPGNVPNSWVQRCVNLDEHVLRLREMPDVAPVAASIPVRVKLRDGTILTLPLEEYLRGVVPAEMGAEWLEVPDDPAIPHGGVHVEPTQIEALRAQVVLARSYAMWRVAHRRHPSFDVYSTTADQVYDPTMIHARSDAAIRGTEGVYLVDAAGQAFKAEYVSACGRLDCPWCNGAAGYNSLMWADRACQFGIQALAVAGKTWREIAVYYYRDVQLSDCSGGE